MKVICSGSDLAQALQKVSRVLPEKNLIPALDGIKITAKDNKLVVSATDSEMLIEASIVANTQIEGETVVTGRTFVDIIKRLDDKELEIKCVDEKLFIRYDESEGILCCFDINDYPKQKEYKKDNFFCINTMELKDLIDKIEFCAAKDDTRPVLKGCYFEIKDNHLIGVALDGFRLSKCEKELVNSQGNFEIIVPARALKEISALIGNEEECTIYVDEKAFMTNLDCVRIESKLIEGKYINYNKIIPSEAFTTINVPKDALINALERVNVLGGKEKIRIVKFESTKNWLTLSANTEIGSIVEKLHASHEGEDITVAFNVRYCLELLKRINNENIKIDFINNLSAAKFMGEECFLGLILPVRLN